MALPLALYRARGEQPGAGFPGSCEQRSRLCQLCPAEPGFERIGILLIPPADGEEAMEFTNSDRLGTQPAAPVPAALRSAGSICSASDPSLVCPGTSVAGYPAARGSDWHLELGWQVPEPAQIVLRALNQF